MSKHYKHLSKEERDRLAILSRLLPDCGSHLAILQPDTVIR